MQMAHLSSCSACRPCASVSTSACSPAAGFRQHAIYKLAVASCSPLSRCLAGATMQIHARSSHAASTACHSLSPDSVWEGSSSRLDLAHAAQAQG